MGKKSNIFYVENYRVYFIWKGSLRDHELRIKYIHKICRANVLSKLFERWIHRYFFCQNLQSLTSQKIIRCIILLQREGIYITIAFIRKTIFFMVDLSHAIFINHEYAIVLDHLLLSAKFLHYLAVDWSLIELYSVTTCIYLLICIHWAFHACFL